MIGAGRVETLGPVILIGLLAMWAGYDSRRWGVGIAAGLLMLLLLMW